MLRPLPTEQQSSTRGSVQRCSHRRVAAHACGTCAASRSCPPRPRPGNADFSIHDPRAVERGPGSWEGAAMSLFMRVWSFLSATRLCCGRRGFAGRAGTSCHSTSLLSSSRRLSILPPAAVSEESRLLCRPEAWEGGNPAHRRGHDLVTLYALVLCTDLSQVQAVPRPWPMMCRLPPNQTRPTRSRA